MSVLFVRIERRNGKATVVADEHLHVAEDLRIALVRVGRYGDQVLTVFLVDGGGLRVQHEGDGQKALHCLVLRF